MQRVTYKVKLIPSSLYDNVESEVVEVEGTSIQSDGELVVYNDGTIEAIFANHTWLYVQVLPL
jgi:hypothetical protein